MHIEALEGAPRNRSKRAQVSVTVGIQQPNECCRKPVSEALVRQQCAGLDLAQHSRTDHEVGTSGIDRSNQFSRIGRVFGQVRLHEHEDVNAGREGSQSSKACRPIASIRLGDDCGATRCGDFRRVIGRTVVSHNNGRVQRSRYGIDQLSYHRLLIESRDNKGSATFRVRVHL